MSATPSLTPVDLRELIPSWTVSLRASGKTDETVRVYVRNVNQFIGFCEAHPELEPMSRRTLEAFIVDLFDRGRQGMTARGRQVAVRQFAKWLVAVDELDADPFDGVKPPAIDTKVIHPLTDGQMRELLATCKTPKGAAPERVFLDVRDAAILKLLFETGLRVGELLRLELDDVHWSEDPAYLVVQRAKARRGRTVPFSPQAALAISTYLRARRKHPIASSKAMWLGARGKPLAYAGLYDALERRAEAAGIQGFHPHLLRHTAADRWLSKGGSESGLMSMAGWSRPEMLHRYTGTRAEARTRDEARSLNLGDL